MSKIAFRSGEYLNHYIDDVVDHDPAYILEMFETHPEMGITEEQYNKARRVIDEWDGNTDLQEDFFFLEQAGYTTVGGYDE